MADTLIQYENVTKRFGDLVAVDDVSFEVEQGELLALLGPSGSGKTTTLRMLAGFESVTEGQIRLDGVDVTGIPAHKRDAGMVFQDYALFPHMSVLENVGYGLRLLVPPPGQSRRE
jgi:ABC-type Fe3+/spermidine/putrescine transport system ATPase subunit